MADTFTDFMIHMMADEDSVKQAVVIIQTDKGTGHYIWQAETSASRSNMLGLMRFATLSMEHDIAESWKSD